MTATMATRVAFAAAERTLRARGILAATVGTAYGRSLTAARRGAAMTAVAGGTTAVRGAGAGATTTLATAPTTKTAATATTLTNFTC